jgi:VCBS repeat-containing protein
MSNDSTKSCSAFGVGVGSSLSSGWLSASKVQCPQDVLDRSTRTRRSPSEANELRHQSLQAVDDIIDVKLRLAPAGTLPENRYDRSTDVHEYYRLDTSGGGGSEVSLNVSSFCADSLRRNDGYLELYREANLSDLIADKKIIIADEGEGSGQVTLKGLRLGSSYLECENSNAHHVLIASRDQTPRGAPSELAFDYSRQFVSILRNDTTGARDGARASIDDGHGVFYGGGGYALVPGKYGILTIERGEYVGYIPKADPAIIGKVDAFTYKLLNTHGDEDTANIIVRIGSDQADVEWDANDPFSPAIKADVWDFDGTASIETVVKSHSWLQEGAVAYAWEVDDQGVVSGRTEGGKFIKVAEDSRSDLLIDVHTRGAKDLLASTEVEFSKGVGVMNFIVASTFEIGTELIRVTDSGFQISVKDLKPGIYHLDMSHYGSVTEAGSIRADLLFDERRFFTGEIKPASGNVLDDNVLGGDAPEFAVRIEGEGYRVPSAEGSHVRGAYGTLSIRPDGSYEYVPDNDRSNIGQVDTFRYQLRSSDGAVVEKRLTIGIEGGHKLQGVEGDEGIAETVPLNGLDADHHAGEEGGATGETAPAKTVVGSAAAAEWLSWLGGSADAEVEPEATLSGPEPLGVIDIMGVLDMLGHMAALGGEEPLAVQPVL